MNTLMQMALAWSSSQFFELELKLLGLTGL